MPRTRSPEETRADAPDTKPSGDRARHQRRCPGLFARRMMQVGEWLPPGLDWRVSPGGYESW
jgi:hypothetical protein